MRDRSAATDSDVARRRGLVMPVVPMRIALAGIAAAALVVGASAQPSHRSSSRKSQPTPITRTAPDVTATIPTDKATEKKAPVLATQDYGETLPKPFDLPAASRSRMRACGAKWQAIKMSGEAHSDTWREFAEKCLTERESTASKASP